MLELPLNPSSSPSLARGKTGVLHKRSWGGKINISYLRLPSTTALPWMTCFQQQEDRSYSIGRLKHFWDSCLWLGREGSPQMGSLCEHQIPLAAHSHVLAEQKKCTLPKVLSSVEAQPWCWRQRGWRCHQWENYTQVRLLLCKSTRAPVTGCEISPGSEDIFKDPYLNSNQTSN